MFSPNTFFLLAKSSLVNVRAFFSDQGDINLAFGDDNLFFISTFTYQNRGADVLTEIGNRINRFLNGEEITASRLVPPRNHSGGIYGASSGTALPIASTANSAITRAHIHSDEYCLRGLSGRREPDPFRRT